MERRRTIGAYGLVRDDRGRVLLVRGADGGPWELPGGDVAHGEHPATAAVRTVRAQLGRPVRVVGLHAALTDIDVTPVPWHHDRIVYDLALAGPNSSLPETALARWFEPGRLDDLDLARYAAEALDRPLTDIDQVDDGPVEVGLWARFGSAVSPDDPTRRQRFAAYGLVTGPGGEVLLALITPGYPGAGHWHLPGGGTDFGESAAAGLLREIAEETSQQARITGLLIASHRYSGLVMGPEGVAVDLHGIRVVFRAEVDHPTPPAVAEEDGSTVAAAWYPPAEALGLPLTEIARDCVARYLVGPA